jgi:hypothetical protein
MPQIPPNQGPEVNLRVSSDEHGRKFLTGPKGENQTEIPENLVKTQLSFLQKAWNATVGFIWPECKWVKVENLADSNQRVSYVYNTVIQERLFYQQYQRDESTSYKMGSYRPPSQTSSTSSESTTPLISSPPRSPKSASSRPLSPPPLTRTPSADLPKPPAKPASSQKLTPNQQIALDQLIKDLRMSSKNPSIAEINAAIANIQALGGSDRVNSSISRCEQVGIKGINY